MVMIFQMRQLNWKLLVLKDWLRNGGIDTVNKKGEGVWNEKIKWLLFLWVSRNVKALTCLKLQKHGFVLFDFDWKKVTEQLGLKRPFQLSPSQAKPKKKEKKMKRNFGFPQFFLIEKTLLLRIAMLLERDIFRNSPCAETHPFPYNFSVIYLPQAQTPV